MIRTTIIGIDCAVDEKNVGIAVGDWSPNGFDLNCLPSREEVRPLSHFICSYIVRSARVLLAFDAPLGWPSNMGQVLAQHRAGMPIVPAANLFFRRGTDPFVKSCFGKQPLDVGVDRIARTARAALELLDEIRKKSGLEIPLAWDPVYEQPVLAIEVYPAGTLIAHGLPSSGYKRKDQIEVRRHIIDGLNQRIHFAVDQRHAENHSDVLDAIVCVLAGIDFLTGKALSPDDLTQAEKEGWIWIKKGHNRKVLHNNRLHKDRSQARGL